ncbi:general odorant-binding protein 56a [Drosophila pseudoobscura]|uniref:General odorant-binding protein 56a n=1 Tax=Drosophila pseudoobscura pseudoobscura TaxID=46245 RepID=A0A6I8UHK4_DROPS|nr:general odorant-binding protein 56a [Drosophila pseudoobscura]
MMPPMLATTSSLLLMLLLLQMDCVRGQGFDLTKILVSRGTEPIWTVMVRQLPHVQDMIDTGRRECIKELKLPKDQRPLMRVSNPSEKEKCLIECVLKKTKIMDDKNKLNLAQVEKLTGLVTQDNKMAIALSCSLAQTCNRSISAKNPCEAAHQLNQCISRQLERNNVKLIW